MGIDIGELGIFADAGKYSNGMNKFEDIFSLRDGLARRVKGIGVNGIDGCSDVFTVRRMGQVCLSHFNDAKNSTCLSRRAWSGIVRNYLRDVEKGNYERIKVCLGGA